MNAAQLTELLKKHQPTSLRVELDTGDYKTIPIRKAGNRWSGALKVLDALRWVNVEFLDGKGGVLFVVESEDDEDIDDDASPRSELPQLAKIMSGLMTGVMKEVKGMFQAQLDGMAKLTAAMTDGLRLQSEAYAERERAIRIAAASGDDGGSEVMDMMKMAFMLKSGMPISTTPAPKKEG